MLVRIIQRRHRSFFETGKTKLYYITDKLYKIDLISAFITASIFSRRGFSNEHFKKKIKAHTFCALLIKFYPQKVIRCYSLSFIMGYCTLPRSSPPIFLRQQFFWTFKITSQYTILHCCLSSLLMLKTVTKYWNNFNFYKNISWWEYT